MTNHFKKTLLLILCMATEPLAAERLASQISHIRAFSNCFAIASTTAEEFSRAGKLIADPPCFSLCLLTNTRGYLSFVFSPGSFSEELRNCYYSQAAIRGALKMYNAEHTDPLRRITSELLNNPDSPLMPDYLKHPFPKPSPQCRYESAGDLVRGDLLIYCTYHGAPAGDQNRCEETATSSAQQ